MTEEQKIKIKNYVLTLGTFDSDKLDFIIDEVVDRALNFMRRDDLPKELERVIARAIYNSNRKYESEEEGSNQKISSVSDQGQSVSYSNSLLSYMATQSDEEIFDGITSQLMKFRKVGVVRETT